MRRHRGHDASVEVSDAGRAKSQVKPVVSQVMVLTNSGRRGMSNRLLKKLRGVLSMPVNPIEGLNAKDFESEADLESQSRIPMSLADRDDWHRLAAPSPGAVADPALACSLGHKEMWTHAAKASAWSLILEDDVLPFANFTQQLLEAVMMRTEANGADIVFLDDRHCQSYGHGLLYGGGVRVHGGVSSAAYAVTPRSAKLLLRAPFLMHPDRLLNKLAHDSAAAAYCPTRPLFSVTYQHESQIGDTLAKSDGVV